jgi:transcriptional regulator with XRE-family HTH domain
VEHGAETFGKTLQRLRRLRGTQKDVAVKIPMDLGYYSKLENDKLAYPPSRETIEKIARALECTPAEKNELLVAAGRIDPEIEEYARLALKEPEVRRLFKAVSRLDRELLEELRLLESVLYGRPWKNLRIRSFLPATHSMGMRVR